MSKPFFSIILPTKNRSLIVGNAIKSALLQTFGDFELVVVDNDDTDATSKVVQSFDDKRIVHLRTGGLSMPDNWEYAVTKFKGEYLLYLEDKQALKRHALEKVSSIVHAMKPKILVCLFDSFLDGKLYRDINFEYTKKIESIPSRKILENIIGMCYNWGCFPVGFNSCVHRDLVAEILRGPFKRMCPPVSPDVTMGLQQLNLVDEILFLFDSLSVRNASDALSNGVSFVKKGSEAQVFLKQIGLNDQQLCSHVPIKILTLQNSVLNDYFKLADAWGGKMKEFKLDIPKYFANIYLELLENSGNYFVDLSMELSEWHKAFSDIDQGTQAQIISEFKAVRASRRLFKEPSTIGERVKTICKALGFAPLWRRLRGSSPDRRVYKDILDCATR